MVQQRMHGTEDKYIEQTNSQEFMNLRGEVQDSELFITKASTMVNAFQVCLEDLTDEVEEKCRTARVTSEGVTGLEEEMVNESNQEPEEEEEQPSEEISSLISFEPAEPTEDRFDFKLDLDREVSSKADPSVGSDISSFGDEPELLELPGFEQELIFPGMDAIEPEFTELVVPEPEEDLSETISPVLEESDIVPHTAEAVLETHNALHDKSRFRAELGEAAAEPLRHVLEPLSPVVEESRVVPELDVGELGNVDMGESLQSDETELVETRPLLPDVVPPVVKVISPRAKRTKRPVKPIRNEKSELPHNSRSVIQTWSEAERIEAWRRNWLPTMNSQGCPEGVSQSRILQQMAKRRRPISVRRSTM
jgi:hypothetical protein